MSFGRVELGAGRSGGRPVRWPGRFAGNRPGPQSAQIAVMFACFAQPHDHTPRQQGEIARVDRQPDAGRGRHDAVETKVAEPKKPTFLASNPPHEYDVEALQMFLDESRNRLGGILQVAVHDDDDVAGHMVEGGAQRRLVAEVSRESPRLVISGWVATAAANNARVRSVLPSSTKTISWGPPGSASSTS